MKIEKLFSGNALSNKLVNQILLIITFTVILIFTCFHLDRVLNILNYIFLILGPILGGIAIAYVINLLLKFLENKVFGFLTKKKFKFWEKAKRTICIVLSFVFIFLFFWAILALIIPELESSLNLLLVNIPIYIESTYSSIVNFQQNHQYSFSFLSDFDWESLSQNVTTFISTSLKSLLSLTRNLTSGIINLLLSIIFSIYLLASKETLLLKAKEYIYAFFSKEKAKKITDVCSLTNKIFTGFVSGQLTEAFILAFLCYIGMSIFRFDYALLISVIIGITAVIPIFGAYIGASVGAFVLFLVSPVSSLCFIIYILILQQLENNIIYPKVVGSSIGLPGLWVLFSIIVFGNVFGIIGVLIGVPAFSVIYTLFDTMVKNKLASKEIKIKEIENS